MNNVNKTKLSYTIQKISHLSSNHSPVMLNIMKPSILILPCLSFSKDQIIWKRFSSTLENCTNLKIFLKTWNKVEFAAHQRVKSTKSAVWYLNLLIYKLQLLKKNMGPVPVDKNPDDFFYNSFYSGYYYC